MHKNVHPGKPGEEIMNENVKIVFGLLGGLALFLYGMNGMSDALQKTAGDKMKKILRIN